MLSLKTKLQPYPLPSFPLHSEAVFSPPHSPWFNEGSGDSEGSDLARESDEDDLEPFLSNPSRRKQVREGSAARGSSPKKIFGFTASEKNHGYPYNTHPSASLSHSLYCEESLHVDLLNGRSSFTTTHCPILHKLRMYFGPHGFVCEKCGLLYPPKYLDAHIRSKHHANDLEVPSSRIQSRQVYRVIVAHLLTSHGVREDTVFNLPETISDTIPGLIPILCYKCPACPTPRWLQWKSLGVHYLEEHKPARRPDKQTMKPRYIIRPYRVGSREGTGGRSDLSNAVILLPEEWTPKKKCVTGLDSIATVSNVATSKIGGKRKRRSGESSDRDILESPVEEVSCKKLIKKQGLSLGLPSINVLQSVQKEQLMSAPSSSLEPILLNQTPTPNTLLLDQVGANSGDCRQKAPTGFSSGCGENNPSWVPQQRTAHQRDIKNAQTERKHPSLPPSGSGARNTITIQVGDRRRPKHLRTVGHTSVPDLAGLLAKVEQIRCLQHEISIDSDAMLRLGAELIEAMRTLQVDFEKGTV